MSGPYGAFTFQVPNADGTTTATTCRFDNAPLTFDHLSNAVTSVGVVLVKIPSTTPNYTLNSTQTRFPSAGLPTALMSQVQELIPLVKIQARATGYPAIYVSDGRCTMGGQLYQARLLTWSSISQSLGNDADDASFVLGNADRVMGDLANAVDLWRATIEFALFPVGRGSNWISGAAKLSTGTSTPVQSFRYAAVRRPPALRDFVTVCPGGRADNVGVSGQTHQSKSTTSRRVGRHANWYLAQSP
jgi:hypothetical protein